MLAPKFGKTAKKSALGDLMSLVFLPEFFFLVKRGSSNKYFSVRHLVSLVFLPEKITEMNSLLKECLLLVLPFGILFNHFL